MRHMRSATGARAIAMPAEGSAVGSTSNSGHSSPTAMSGVE